MPLDRADTEATPKAILRSDYAPPAYLVDEVALDFDIGETLVEVTATLAIRRNTGGPLVLDGQELDTKRVEVDGKPFPYRIDGERLILDGLPEAFRLTTQVAIDAIGNTALEGLYQSGGMLCTQCEAEGFRRITWYPDRPDVMARFTVTIRADKARYPVLLSNGNLIEQADEGARHRAVWQDPFPKPCYLFALVAGDLALVEGPFTTRSGREVALKFWVEHGNEDQVGHALESLKKSMAWDEQVFGLEYDLDVYNVVAVSHFNMGAMENKSLNIFNSKYVLAKPETATDGDFLGIESVIAHEYFHNWTGNRVTCRDWFQLTLKEGLTVFRDQEFSADMNSRGLQRIEDVRALRAAQFPEDNGPMAHPIRPESYVEINNFYTSTVYEKGSEVIRMIHTLLGAEGFRKGMDLYFQRHDGQAVTCEDFVAAMEDASGIDLKLFRRWYAQAGTPKITAQWSHDAAARRLSLTLSQATKPTPGQPDKLPFHIPVAMGLVGASGADKPLRLEGENAAGGTTRVLNLTEPSQTFVFEDMDEPATPSLLRGFSAPVTLDAPYTQADLAFLMANDSDAFNRWDSGQELAARVLLELVRKHQAGEALTLDEGLAAAWGKVLADHQADVAFAAEALTLPGFAVLGERMEVIDVDGIYAARKFLVKALAERHRDALLSVRASLAETGYSLSPTAIGKRRLRNLSLGYLSELGGDDICKLAQAQYDTATCMTDQLSALACLIALGKDAAEGPLDRFFQQWQGDKLVVNKWLGLQAGADWPDVLDRVKALLTHPAFDPKEPNKTYALIGGFSANPPAFHRADGSGYEFMADRVIALDSTNPQVAARMVRSLMRWKRYDPKRQALMKAQLERIRAKPGLSRDVGEIVEKALA